VTVMVVAVNSGSASTFLSFSEPVHQSVECSKCTPNLQESKSILDLVTFYFYFLGGKLWISSAAG
jgi:hypothetical protein